MNNFNEENTKMPDKYDYIIKNSLKLLFVIFVIVGLSSVLFSVFKDIKEELPYYYTEGKIVDLNTGESFSGTLYYLNIQLKDGTNKVKKVNAETYFNVNKEQNVFVVLNTNKKDIVSIFLTNKELLDFIEAQNVFYQEVKILE